MLLRFCSSDVVKLGIHADSLDVGDSPGRFYAAAVMKVVVAQIISNYDVELVEPDAPRWWTWRSSMLPKASTMVTLTPREGVL